MQVGQALQHQMDFLYVGREKGSCQAVPTKLEIQNYQQILTEEFPHDFLSFGFFSWRPKCVTTNHMRTFSPLIGRMCSEQEQHCSGLVNNMEQLFLTFVFNIPDCNKAFSSNLAYTW